jgi:hypothetical protein
MVDTENTDLDVGTILEKRGRGRPCGSKNKPKVVIMEMFSSPPAKWRLGRPLGSKNKARASSSQINESLDVSVANPNPPQPSIGTVFSFFALAGAQCREQQHVPLKFTEFMDDRELCDAILQELSSEGSPYEVEVYYDGNGEMFFRGGWPRFAKDYDLHQGWFLLFDYHCGTTKFDVKIFDGTQCQKKYEAKVYFH